MKKVSLFLFVLFSLNALAFTDPKVGGTVRVSKKLEKKLQANGVLYVFAKKAGPNSGPNDHQPPVAVVRIQNPHFPQAFVITANDVMIKGTQFAGPLHVIARYTDGDAIRKPGAIEGDDAKFRSIDLGKKDLDIELNNLIK